MTETIKFENKEYVWQEVEGKGRCLVPYSNLRKYSELQPGDVFKHPHENYKYIMISPNESWFEHIRISDGSKATLMHVAINESTTKSLTFGTFNPDDTVEYLGHMTGITYA